MINDYIYLRMDQKKISKKIKKLNKVSDKDIDDRFEKSHIEMIPERGPQKVFSLGLSRYLRYLGGAEQSGETG